MEVGNFFSVRATCRVRVTRRQLQVPTARLGAAPQQNFSGSRAVFHPPATLQAALQLRHFQPSFAVNATRRILVVPIGGPLTHWFAKMCVYTLDQQSNRR